jgi:hypothetical protein
MLAYLHGASSHSSVCLSVGASFSSLRFPPVLKGSFGPKNIKINKEEEAAACRLSALSDVDISNIFYKVKDN